jgi:hypothetical protein
MLYRGQKYGDPVGVWWSDKRSDAEQCALARCGGSYVILGLDEDDPEWLAAHFMFPDDGQHGNWYKIMPEALGERWHGVRIVDGSIRLVTTGENPA